ncbi:MAG: hypothetical protein LIP11_01660 [Clostridiales bacterium]|nr:hypothetical protein [Clostridiales bacterium]
MNRLCKKTNSDGEKSFTDAEGLGKGAGTMMERMREMIRRDYRLTELDCGDYASQKLNGMTFRICAFQAQGLGHVSMMQASGFFGLMAMDTLIINPTWLDLPLLSYDRVLAMGNDTLIYELYDTLLSPVDLSALETVQTRYEGLPAHDTGQHWYDPIKLPVSLARKGKKAQRTAFDACARDYLAAYLAAAKSASVCDPTAKQEKAAVYVEGLLTHGGPSTDVFLKALGREKTEKLFRTVLFGTKKVGC